MVTFVGNQWVLTDSKTLKGVSLHFPERALHFCILRALWQPLNYFFFWVVVLIEHSYEVEKELFKETLRSIITIEKIIR